MKKKTIFKDTLLISQEQMTMLLKVNKSQWAMYEINKRDLPSQAKIKLAKLLEVANQLSEVGTHKIPQELSQEEKNTLILNDAIKDNYRKQLATQIKLETSKRKYEEALRTIHFVTFLKKEEELNKKK